MNGVSDIVLVHKDEIISGIYILHVHVPDSVVCFEFPGFKVWNCHFFYRTAELTRAESHALETGGEKVIMLHRYCNHQIT